jgi:diadenylate cyclase
MTFDKYIKIATIIDLKTTDKIVALKETAQALCKACNIRKQKTIIAEMLKREEAASTFIGQGLAIPQTHGPMKNSFAIAVARCLEGVEYDAARGARAHIIVLVLARDDEETNAGVIELLSEIATFFKSKEIQDALLSNEHPIDIKKFIADFTHMPYDEKQNRTKAANIDPVIANAVLLFNQTRAAALFVFADTVRDNDFLSLIKVRKKTIIVTSNKTRFNADELQVLAIIQAPSFPASRTGQIKIGVLLALSRNLIQKTDRVVCLSGNSLLGAFDTIVTLDVESEYEFFFTAAQMILPPDVKPEVFERVLALAGEIAVEGREGKPTGTIFVVGDTNTVNGYVRQLIINPFRGYSEAERNILDPGLGETMKEFSAIDGAFIITGDGIVLAAGSYLRPLSEVEALPSGFGSRHAAAAGITGCTTAMAITVSESTGMVSVFKSGALLMTIAKPLTNEKNLVQKMW